MAITGKAVSEFVRAYPRGAAYATLTCLVLTVLVYGTAVLGIKQDVQNGPDFWRLFGAYGTWLTLTTAAFVSGAGLFWAAMRLAGVLRPALR